MSKVGKIFDHWQIVVEDVAGGYIWEFTDPDPDLVHALWCRTSNWHEQSFAIWAATHREGVRYAIRERPSGWRDAHSYPDWVPIEAREQLEAYFFLVQLPKLSVSA